MCRAANYEKLHSGFLYLRQASAWLVASFVEMMRQVRVLAQAYPFSPAIDRSYKPSFQHERLTVLFFDFDNLRERQNSTIETRSIWRGSTQVIFESHLGGFQLRGS